MDIGSYSDGAPEHTAGSASEEDEKLSWRSDPLESHSDWTVVVKVERDAKQAVSEANSKYTVHKNTLGFGPRKSEYFATIFQTNLKEGAAQESELVLPRSAADVFPVVLDFMYRSGDEIEKRPLSAFQTTAIMHLADRLRIKALFKAISSVIQAHLQPQTALVYAREAAKYRLDKLVDAAVSVCAENFDELVLFEDDFGLLPTSLYSRIASATSCASEPKSICITRYICKTKEMVDRPLFQKLCCGLSDISPCSAVQLLRLACDREILPGSGQQNISDLCIRDAAKAWKSIELDDAYHKLPDCAKVKLLEAVFLAAKASDTKLQKNLESAKTTLIGQVDAYMPNTHYHQGQSIETPQKSYLKGSVRSALDYATLHR